MTTRLSSSLVSNLYRVSLEESLINGTTMLLLRLNGLAWGPLLEIFYIRRVRNGLTLAIVIHFDTPRLLCRYALCQIRQQISRNISAYQVP